MRVVANRGLRDYPVPAKDGALRAGSQRAVLMGALLSDRARRASATPRALVVVDKMKRVERGDFAETTRELQHRWGRRAPDCLVVGGEDDAGCRCRLFETAERGPGSGRGGARAQMAEPIARSP